MGHEKPVVGGRHWLCVWVVVWQKGLQSASLRQEAALKQIFSDIKGCTMTFTWRTVSGPGRRHRCPSIFIRRLSLEQHATQEHTLWLTWEEPFQFSSSRQHRAGSRRMGHNFIWQFLGLQSLSWNIIYQKSQHPELSLRPEGNFSIKKLYAKEHMIWFTPHWVIW